MMHEPRIVFAGGGTGGHLYPALTVANELRRRHPQAQISFIGARRGLEQRLVPAAGFALRSLRIAGLKGRGPMQRLSAVLAAGWAVAVCSSWMLRQRPSLVIGVGGYASGPAMLAALLLRVRTMVLEQNHFPGATNRWLAPRVDAVCVPSDAARQRLDGTGTVTGNPTRPEFHHIADVEPKQPLSLLVFGGSRGARSINEAMLQARAKLQALEPTPRVVHQTGEADFERVLAAGADDARYETCAFLDDMPRRLNEAQLVLCRAGASTLAELSAAGRAALLIPYPHAADDHQMHNARTLEQAGAAEIIPDAELDGIRLAESVARFVAQPERLIAMGRAARSLALPDSTARVADIADALIDRGNADVS